MYVDNSYSNMAEKNWIQQAHERMQPLKIRYDSIFKEFYFDAHRTSMCFVICHFLVISSHSTLLKVLTS